MSDMRSTLSQDRRSCERHYVAGMGQGAAGLGEISPWALVHIDKHCVGILDSHNTSMKILQS